MQGVKKIQVHKGFSVTPKPAPKRIARRPGTHFLRSKFGMARLDGADFRESAIIEPVCRDTDQHFGSSRRSRRNPHTNEVIENIIKRYEVRFGADDTFMKNSNKFKIRAIAGLTRVSNELL